jgi:inorganic pyrophosphatase
MPRKTGKRQAQSRSLERLAPFEDDCLVVVIETPKGSANKLAFEPRYGTFVLKRVLPAGEVFPFDFGFVPSTRAEDGDPLDVLVLMDAPVVPGCVVPSRLIGVIEGEQSEDGKTERNDRLLAVAAKSSTHRSIHKLNDLSGDLVRQIERFFVSYHKGQGSTFTVKRKAGRKHALALVKAALTKRSRQT